jgi:ribonuclease P protein component
LLNRKNRLTNNSEFQQVYNQGRSFAGSYVVLYVKKNRMEHTRFGFTVSKKIGNAVERNRIKRIMREICRLNLERFAEGYDLIFVARRKIKGISYRLVEHEMGKLCIKAGVWRD